MTKIAVLDLRISGISGDMLLSSLIDAGADRKTVLDSIYSCEDFLEGSKILEAKFQKVLVKGINATLFHLKSEDRSSVRSGNELLTAGSRCCEHLGLDETTRTYILNSMRTMIAAESEIHGESIEAVHLHETSSIDTLVDLIGSGIAIRNLGLFSSTVYSTPIATGSGLAQSSHGITQNPSNAVLKIFLNRPFLLTAGYSEYEMTTPTGAALLANLCAGSISRYPDLQLERMGFGAGSRDLPEVANVTRFVMGEHPSNVRYLNDIMVVLETTVDDVTGEEIGAIVERLGSNPVKDITVIPGLSKKNRPNYTIRAIIDYPQLDTTLELFFKETGTLGVRIQEVHRAILNRDVVIVRCSILENEFEVRVKVSKDNMGNSMRIKPEFEDIKKISEGLGIPLRVANQIALSEIHTKLGY